MKVFPGNYEDYMWRKQGGTEAAPTLDDVLIGTPPAIPVPMPAPGQNAANKRVNPMKLKQMQDRATALEEQISALETTIGKTELALSQFSSPEETRRLCR